MAQKRIADKIKEMDTEQARLGEFVRVLYQKGEKSYLEILLANDALSEYFDQMQYLETVEGDLGVVVKKIRAVKEKLENRARLSAQIRAYNEAHGISSEPIRLYVDGPTGL